VGVSVEAEQEVEVEGKKNSWIESMFKKTKDWFESEPDKDF